MVHNRMPAPFCLPAHSPAAVSAYTAQGAVLSVCPGRVAYHYALKGPAVAVDTACSSSLYCTVTVFVVAAGMSVRQVAGLQLHGTGTSLGDPIEVGAAAGEFLSNCGHHRH